MSTVNWLNRNNRTLKDWILNEHKKRKKGFCLRLIKSKSSIDYVVNCFFEKYISFRRFIFTIILVVLVLKMSSLEDLMFARVKQAMTLL